MSTAMPRGVVVTGDPLPGSGTVLTPQALDFVASLHREFGARRRARLAARAERQRRLDAGERPDFLAATQAVRDDASWQVRIVPADLQRRHVEITGPTDARMLINALNSGADVFMADFEDANAPTWSNMVQGQANLGAAIERTLTFRTPDKEYRIVDDPAVLMVRPRGWHLAEKHVTVDGESVSASLFDFGLYAFHNTGRLLQRGTAPYFYLPKLESHLEARLWNDVIARAQERLGVPVGTYRVTVLVETILAAFEMDEILYELRDHITGLNAGRWDYMFSVIKKFRARPDFHFPDRAQVSMTAPFMRAYTELLVRTCHRRGAHAMGGMAAFIPSRRDAVVNATALARVREDKEREVTDGFDGTWVAHPDLVAVARDVFHAALGERPHQKHRLREDVRVTAGELADFRIPGGSVSEAGVLTNVRVGLQYLEAWLRGSGAVAIANLMEDVATAEICRAQLWQWVRRGAPLAGGGTVDAGLVQRALEGEIAQIRAGMAPDDFAASRYERAAAILQRLVASEEFDEFLTLVAYDELE